MKGKKQKEKKKIAKSEVVSEIRKEFKDDESKYQILGNAGGEYIKTKLPKNFFESIIFGEMSLEYDFSIEKLTQLMDLYSLGIQYFLENNPSRAKSFQDRMGFILTNKDTLLNLKRKKKEEQREKEEQEKSKTEKKEEKIENFSKSAKNLPKSNMRKRARTNFMVKSQNIKDEEIQRKVSFVLKNDTKIKEEKENVKNIIKDDINKQNLKWKEKLQAKRNNLNTSFGSGIRPRHRTFFIKMKKFQTPGPIQDRAIMTLKSPNITKSPTQNNIKSNFNNINNNISKKNSTNINFIDIESSQGDEAEKNEGDIDFLKQFKAKHSWKEEDKKEKNDGDKNEEKKDDEDDSDSDSDSSGTLNSDEFLKKIDEVDEEGFSLRQTAKYDDLNKKNEKSDRKVSQFKIETEENKDIDKNMDIFEDKNDEEITIKKDETNENSTSNQTGEIKNDFPLLKRKSIVDENIIRKIDLDEEIVKSIEEKMKNLENLDKQNSINKINSKDDEEENENQKDEISSISNNANPIQDLKLTIDDIPLKYQDTYEEVEEKMKKYVKELNDHFYKDTFEVFSLELKELYDKKYNKYIEVNDEYHHNIKEKEYQLENDENINEEKKVEIQQIIDSLKEEQKDQIDKITDEYNELIDKKIAEFKQTFFKKDCGINLMEEQLKLDIYTMINEAFY